MLLYSCFVFASDEMKMGEILCFCCCYCDYNVIKLCDTDNVKVEECKWHFLGAQQLVWFQSCTLKRGFKDPRLRCLWQVAGCSET